MKRIVALLGIMCLTVTVYADTIVPRLSLNFPGTHSTDVSGAADIDTELSGAIGVEYLHRLNDTFEVGAGTQYTFDTKLKDSVAAFNFLPVYITGTYAPFKDLGTFAPYVKANAGYNMLFNGNDNYKGNADLGGGFYWAAGIGTKFLKDFSADVMYSSYTGNYDDTPSADVTYSTIGLNVGYAFGL